MPHEPEVPESIEAITPEWLTGVVSIGQPGAVAESVEVVDAHSGTTGRVRLRVQWKGRTEAPEALFGKLAPTDEVQRQMVAFTDMGRREARFYASGAANAPVRVPAPVWSGWTDDPGRYFMLLEDLEAAGCTFPSSKPEDSAPYLEGMIDTLAKLHGHFWESPRFGQDLAWVEAPMRSDYGPMLVGQGIEQYEGEMPSESVDLAQIYLEHNADLCDWLDDGPQTLLHGDSHVGNTFIKDGEVGLLDWACTCRAPGIRDISYFMCASVPTELRRAREKELLARYLDGLARAGGIAPDFDDAWLQYRRFAVCGWIAATATAGAGDRMQALDVGKRAMDRAIQAIVDLETPSLLRKELRI